MKLKKPTKLDDRLANITTKHMKAAKYNPRSITNARLAKLGESMNTFGDLSGIVFNVRTKNLVSGHQRMKTIGDAKTRIIQHSHTDDLGTIAIGHVEVKTKSGIIKIPYRAVDWPMVREKAANIAANAHGGNFDKEKLALVLADIEDTKEFDIEVVGLDALTIRSLRLPKDMPENSEVSDDSREFKEYGADLQTDHECPRCHYKW